MRVTAAFDRLLGFSGTVVEEVVFTAAQILVSVRLRSPRLRCPCGRTSSATYDRSHRSWRHLDLGRYNVVVQGQVRRVDCQGCGRVRTEQVPSARPGARHPRNFEDTAARLVRRMSPPDRLRQPSRRLSVASGRWVTVWRSVSGP